jgi:hypothetical protein
MRRNVREQNYSLTTRSQLTSVSGENFWKILGENFGENVRAKEEEGDKSLSMIHNMVPQ